MCRAPETHIQKKRKERWDRDKKNPLEEKVISQGCVFLVPFVFFLFKREINPQS